MAGDGAGSLTAQDTAGASEPGGHAICGHTVNSGEGRGEPVHSFKQNADVIQFRFQDSMGTAGGVGMRLETEKPIRRPLR